MKRGTLLALAVLVPRVAAFVVNENLGGDAIARTWLAHRWLAAPHLMTHFGDGPRQFGPIHLYLLALAEWLWPSLLHAGRVVSLVAGSLTAWPLYVFTARRFGSAAGSFAVLVFAFWGLHVQCSTTSASEALSLLLVMGTVALFDVADAQRAAWWGAAALLNLACATRYDAWLLVPMLAVAEWVRSRRLLRGVAFAAAASVFAIAWLAGNQLGQGSAFFPFRYIDDYHRAWWPQEAALWGRGAFRMLCALFWPGAAVVMLTPPIAILGGVMAWRAWRERPELRWLVALVVLPAVLYGARGALMQSFVPLARFTVKEVLLLLPFAGWGLDRLAQTRPLLARASVQLAVAWCVGLGLFCFSPATTWASSLRAISATSRLDRSTRATVDWLRANVGPTGALLVMDEDPAGFDDLPLTYFSGLPYDAQLRRRSEQFEALRNGRVPRWLVLFEGGRLERSGEVARSDSDVVYLGERFTLRVDGRVRIYER